MEYYYLLVEIITVCYLVGIWIALMLSFGLLATGRDLPNTNAFLRLTGWIAVCTCVGLFASAAL